MNWNCLKELYCKIWMEIGVDTEFSLCKQKMNDYCVKENYGIGLFNIHA